jgi:hypothetical protein
MHSAITAHVALIALQQSYRVLLGKKYQTKITDNASLKNITPEWDKPAMDTAEQTRNIGHSWLPWNEILPSKVALRTWSNFTDTNSSKGCMETTYQQRCLFLPPTTSWVNHMKNDSPWPPPQDPIPQYLGCVATNLGIYRSFDLPIVFFLCKPTFTVE